MTTVTKTVRFDAAHILTDYDGRCKNLHGHTYRVDVSVGDASKPVDGTQADMVIDLKALKAIVGEVVLDRFDHAFICNMRSEGECDIAAAVERQGMRVAKIPYRSTVENLARHFYELLKESLPGLVSVKVWETADNCAEYRA